MQKFKVALYHAIHKTEKGGHPIYLRIYINGKTCFIASGYSVPVKCWNGQEVKAHPLANDINSDLQTKLNNVTQKIIKAQLNGDTITATSIKELMTGKSMTNIFNFVDSFKTEVSGKRRGTTIENYTKHLKKLESFHGSKELSFEQITPTYLLKYENWLKQTTDENKGVGNNYIHKLLTTLRSFFNAAIKRKIISCYPFDSYEFPTYQTPEKDFLNLSELKKLEAAIPDLDYTDRQTVTYFLFGCYSGLRVSDWLVFNPEKNIKNNRLILRAAKNGRDISMIISKPLERILILMKAEPLTITENTINIHIKSVAKKYGIKKHLTTHTARHTFACTICLGNKISSETASELMAITLKTFVGNYSQVTGTKIDRETREAWSELE